MTEVLNSEELFGVHEAFAQTEHGELLASRIRYEKYNLASLSTEEWLRLLGADVNNLTHMPLTQGLVKSFVRGIDETQPGYLDDGERSLLQLAAIIHDQGEAIVGDISFGDKTEADEIEEKLQLENNAEAFCPGLPVRMKQLIVRARDEVVFDSSTKLGTIFNAVERTGYVRTALRAFQHLKKGTAGPSAEGLQWIVADVLSNQPVKLLEYAKQFPALEGYLRAQSELISGAYSIVSPEIFEHYGENRARKEKEFADSSAAWQSWISGAAA